MPSDTAARGSDEARVPRGNTDLPGRLAGDVDQSGSALAAAPASALLARTTCSHSEYQEPRCVDPGPISCAIRARHRPGNEGASVSVRPEYLPDRRLLAVVSSARRRRSRHSGSLRPPQAIRLAFPSRSAPAEPPLRPGKKEKILSFLIISQRLEGNTGWPANGAPLGSADAVADVAEIQCRSTIVSGSLREFCSINSRPDFVCPSLFCHHLDACTVLGPADHRGIVDLSHHGNPGTGDLLNRSNRSVAAGTWSTDAVGSLWNRYPDAAPRPPAQTFVSGRASWKFPNRRRRSSGRPISRILPGRSALRREATNIGTAVAYGWSWAIQQYLPAWRHLGLARLSTQDDKGCTQPTM